MKPALAVLTAVLAISSPARAAEKPKLVVAIVVDQFRYDYLLRFRGEYKEGIDRLLKRGAVFTNASYEHFPTVTAVGHGTFLTGATPSISGIVGNDWYDRESGKNVTSVSDDATRTLGGSGGVGASPRRLLVSALGDELKMSNNRSRLIGISLKDRSAVLPTGHMADGAYWFDQKTGQFVSSTYYFDALPAWVNEFNATHPADRYKGATWMGRKYPDETGEKLYAALHESPFGNDLVEAFAERAVEAEKLGQRGVTDVLAVSFSSNDYVGHALGPDSPEVRDISVRTDQVFGKL